MPVVRKESGPVKRAPAKTVARTQPKVETPSTFDDDILIPTKMSTPPSNFLDYVTLIHGLKGIGKTSVIAALGALIMMWEPRRRNVSARMHYESLVVPGQPLDWDTHEMVAARLCEKGPDAVGFQVIGEDSLDRSYLRCQEAVCQRKGIEHPNQANDYGQTHAQIQRVYEQAISNLCMAGFTPIFTSHTKTREDDSPEPYDLLPTATGKAFLTAKAFCDFVIYYGMIEGIRCFTIRGGTGAYTSCGSEEHFLDVKTGVKLAAFEAGETPALAAKNLLAAFNNQLEGIPYVPGRKLSETDYFQAKLDEAKTAGIVEGETSAQKGSKYRK